MRVRCQNCGTECSLPPGARPEDYYCGVCGHLVLVPVPVPQPANPALPVGGALGGAALGGAIAGPPGAIIGGIIGLLIGRAASQQ